MAADTSFTLVAATPVLASPDIRRSVDFFVTTLGFTEVHAVPGEYGIVERGAVELHFWACDDRALAEATSCRVQVKGIEALAAHCAAAGIVHPNAPLADKPWGTREFAILDPSGNCVTFHEHRDA